MAQRYFKEDSVKLDVKRYATDYLMDTFKVTRQTIATWKKMGAIPAKYTREVISLLRHNE